MTKKHLELFPLLVAHQVSLLVMMLNTKEDQCQILITIGDEDIELLEMAVYDTYREEDKEPYSYRYLLIIIRVQSTK